MAEVIGILLMMIGGLVCLGLFLDWARRRLSGIER